MSVRAHIVREPWTGGFSFYLSKDGPHGKTQVVRFGPARLDEIEEGAEIGEPSFRISGGYEAFETMRAMALAFVEAGFLVYDPDGRQKLVTAHVDDLRMTTTRLMDLLAKAID
jgi:hypothetical protein